MIRVNTPRVSVVLPVFNADRFVRAAIESVLTQTYTDFEFIIIDDGSTDSSLAIIKKAVSADSRCRVISRSNVGLVATCNEGVAESRGAYILRMDQDDISYRERFAAQVAYLNANPECVALGTRVLLADEDLLPIIEAFKLTTHDQIDSENMSGVGSAICHPSAAISREALLAVGGYRAEFEWAEDLDLFLRLAEYGKVGNLPSVFLTYRQHANSVGYSKRRLQRQRAQAAARSARERRYSPDGLPDFQLDLGPGSGGLDSDYESLADIHRKWAWLSLIGGNVRTARKHAFRAFSLEPFSSRNARLIGCAIRGR